MLYRGSLIPQAEKTWLCLFSDNNTLAKRKGQKDNGPQNTAHKTKQTPLKPGDGLRRSDIANTKM